MKKIPIMVVMIAVELGAAYFIMNSILAKPPQIEYRDERPEMVTYDFGELLVNIGTDGRRYFMGNISVSYDPEIEIMPDEIEKNRLLLNDTLTTVLMGCSVRELGTTAGRESLRVDIQRVFENVTQLEIDRILFTKYLIQ